MHKFISKTIYLDYLQCPRNAWLKLHKKHDLQAFCTISQAEQAVLDSGVLTERWARELFPDGVLIETYGQEAVLFTASQVTRKAPILFQSAFFYDKFLACNDVLEYSKETERYKLYEVKAKTSLKENDYLDDVTFQAIVLKEQGIMLENVFIIHLNEKFIRADSVSSDELFVYIDITKEVEEREQQTRLKMQQAKFDLLEGGQEGIACTCIYKGRSNHCKTFSYSNPHISSFSIHDISRIRPEKIRPLIDSNIVDIADVPDDFELTEIQKKQVKVYKSKTPIINFAAIKQELNKLTYPLYFLDYESYSCPIPRFKGFKPWQQMPFQFSLQVLADGNAELVNVVYLHECDSDPSEVIIKKLIRLIGSAGSVVVWHKSFEQMINNQLGERHPEHKAFLQNLNDRFFDLEEIFTKQYYVDPRFNGKTSIKSVLPVLIPDLSYYGLSIQSGDVASAKWFSMITSDDTLGEKISIANELKNYCNFDTYAMYEILLFLLRMQK